MFVVCGGGLDGTLRREVYILVVRLFCFVLFCFVLYPL
jgi:hypothetical protein